MTRAPSAAFDGALACVTCDRALQARIFDDGFGATLALVVTPLAVGAALVAWLAHRVAAADDARSHRAQQIAPVVLAGTLLGLGMGGFLDGIFLHQVLQWHQMLSNHVAPATLEAKNYNMFWDGVFHLGTWSLTAAGVVALWRLVGRTDVARSGALLAGAAVFGWGAFNTLDGTVNHYVLRLHNVREITESQAAWNLGFLLFGVGLVVAGWIAVRAAARRSTRS